MTYKIGQRVELSELGKKWLLPEWKVKTTTGTVTAIVSRDIIEVERDGVRARSRNDAAYWQARRPTSKIVN